jgi:hypothetical protein
VLLAAMLIYRTGQMRELLWIAFGEQLSSKFPEHISFSGLFDYFYAAAFQKGTFSILLAAISLGLWTPVFYVFLTRPREAGAAGLGAKPQPNKAAPIGSIVTGWLAASAFVTIALYNILDVSFPKLSSFDTVVICVEYFAFLAVSPLVITIMAIVFFIMLVSFFSNQTSNTPVVFNKKASLSKREGIISYSRESALNTIGNIQIT